MTIGLSEDYPSVGGADAMIHASAKRAGADYLVTRDQAFGRAFGEGWIDPMDPDSIKRLLD